jgi:hypothetical protein
VKGADPAVGAAVVKAEGADRRVAPAADQVVAVVVRRAAVAVEVVGPADLAAVRVAAGVAGVEAVPAVRVVVVPAAAAAAVRRDLPVAPVAVKGRAVGQVAVVGRRAAAVEVVGVVGVAGADKVAAAVRKGVRAAAGVLVAAVKAGVAETVSFSPALSS